MQKIDLNKKKILVVEDEERNWYVLRDIIRFNNGKPIWAESGMAGIEIVKNESDIALVFMDVRLPFMRGDEAAKQIRTVRPELPIIAQTAFTEKKVMNACLEAGCNEFLLKPIDIKKTTELLGQYLLK